MSGPDTSHGMHGVWYSTYCERHSFHTVLMCYLGEIGG